MLALRAVGEVRVPRLGDCGVGVPEALAVAGREDPRKSGAASSALPRRGLSGHWGQALPANAAVICAGFGQARVDRWLAARPAFMPNASTRRMFSNPMVDACGLGA